MTRVGLPVSDHQHVPGAVGKQPGRRMRWRELPRQASGAYQQPLGVILRRTRHIQECRGVVGIDHPHAEPVEQAHEVRTRLAVDDEVAVADVAALLGKRRRDDGERTSAGTQRAVDQAGDRTSQRRVDLHEYAVLGLNGIGAESANGLNDGASGLSVGLLAHVQVDGQDISIDRPTLGYARHHVRDQLRAERAGRVARAGEVVGEDQQPGYRRRPAASNSMGEAEPVTST